MVDDFCAGKDVNDFGNIQGTIRDIDYRLRNDTAQYMCTPNCPCPTNTNFTQWNEEDFRDYNRTRDNTTLTQAKA